MADISYSGYEQSGFNESSGTADLLAEKAKIPTTDAELKSQAESQYKDTLDILDSSLTRQITSMITSQATDEKLLTEAYNKSVSSMAAKLQICTRYGYIHPVERRGRRLLYGGTD